MATDQTIFVMDGIAIFNTLVGTNNPSFWLVIKCIRQDEATMPFLNQIYKIP